MLGLRRKPKVETPRMTLRLPEQGDWRAWAELRAVSAEFLTPWEPVWSHDHLSRRAFQNRVYWAARAESQGTALPFLMIRREDQALLGAIQKGGLSDAANAMYVKLEGLKRALEISRYKLKYDSAPSAALYSEILGFAA